MSTQITSVGVHIPDYELTNADLERLVETSDAWITQRTGISTRHIAGSFENVRTMAVSAARDALRKVPGLGQDISQIIVASNTVDQPVPNVAMHVARALRHEPRIAGDAVGFDMAAGCGGINYALRQADRTTQGATLVIGVEHLSKFTNYADRATCILFGDGASAYVVEDVDEGGFLGHYTVGNAVDQDSLYLHRDTMVPWSEAQAHLDHPDNEAVELHGLHFKMNGRKVLAYVRRNMKALVSGFEDNARLNPTGISFDDVAAVIPHQANSRMFLRDDGSDCIGRRFDEKVKLRIDRYGNTSTASQGPPFLEYLQTQAQPGDYVVKVGFGAGLIFAANLLQVSEELIENVKK